MRKNKPIAETKKDIITICHMIHSMGFVAATDGNVSAKVGDNRFLITPTGRNKGLLKEEDLITIDSEGKVLTGKSRPSSEFRMHIKAYSLRPDINAALHAHPPYLTAFTIAGKEIPEDMLPEVILTLGKVPTTAYATPSTPEVATVIEETIGNYDAISLSRHGSLTVGKDIYAAYNKLEKIEHAAKIAFIATSLGGVQKLDEDHLEKLTYLAYKLGLRRDLATIDE